MYRNIYRFKEGHLTNQLVIGSQSYGTREAALRHIELISYDRKIYIKTVKVPYGLLLPEWIHSLPICSVRTTRHIIPL